MGRGRELWERSKAKVNELMIMNDTCATHRSRVPLRSSGRIKGATTVEGERGPDQDFYLVFCVQQSSARGCCCSFAYVYFSL